MRVMLERPIVLFNRTMHSSHCLAIRYFSYFCNIPHWGVTAGKAPRPTWALRSRTQSVTRRLLKTYTNTSDAHYCCTISQTGCSRWSGLFIV